jgi:hypothetical protein
MGTCSDGLALASSQKAMAFGFGTKAKAGPNHWPGLACGPALNFCRPRPGQKAMAFDYILFIISRTPSDSVVYITAALELMIAALSNVLELFPP